MWDPYGEFESFTFPNGLTVHVSHWPERDWEAVGFLIHSGAEHDPIGYEGTAHFVEHLVSNNADITKNEIRNFFKSNGGNIELGVTFYDSTRYKFFLPAGISLLKKAFDITGQMLYTSQFKKCLERERKVVIEEFNRSYPTKLKIDLELDLREHKALYSGFWLERFVRPLGIPESINKISEIDLQAYYDTHYVPANMSIVCVGGMSISQVVEIIRNSLFAKEKIGCRTTYPVPIINPGYPTETLYSNKILGLLKRLFRNVCSYRSVAKIPISNNQSTISVVVEMLNKVLNDEVRENRAWTYHISAQYYNYRHFFEVVIRCDALARKASKGIQRVIDECISGLSSNEDLFKEAQHNVFVRNTMIDLSGKSVVDAALDSLAKHYRIRSLSEINSDIKRVTMNDVQELLKWLSPDRRWTFIV